MLLSGLIVSGVGGQVLARRLRLAGDFDFEGVAARTPGFVGADLTALVKEAAAIAVTRIFTEIQAQEQQVVSLISRTAAAVCRTHKVELGDIYRHLSSLCVLHIAFLVVQVCQGSQKAARTRASLRCHCPMCGAGCAASRMRSPRDTCAACCRRASEHTCCTCLFWRRPAGCPFWCGGTTSAWRQPAAERAPAGGPGDPSVGF